MSTIEIGLLAVVVLGHAVMFGERLPIVDRIPHAARLRLGLGLIIAPVLLWYVITI